MKGYFDTLLDLCQDKHRRIILGVIATERRVLTLNDLTNAVLKHNHQMPVTELSEEVVSPIQVSLHHEHLPKLVSEGLITYDPKRHFVEPTEQLEQMQPTLSTILDADPSLETPIKL